MSLELRWVGESAYERVGVTRWMCYGHAGGERQRFLDSVSLDVRAGAGDFLLAERAGEALGTATSMSLSMWVRGARLPCQGVAYVGTIKSARRRGSNEPGVASAVMQEVLREARRRQHVVSALMPFRASYYEHFGYGLVERRTEWTLALAVMPSGDCEGWRMIRPEDHAAQEALRLRAAQQGQCDFERPAGTWLNVRAGDLSAMTFVDRPTPDGPVRAWAMLAQQAVGGAAHVKVQDWDVDSLESFRRMLTFLGTLKDQYTGAIITVPTDWPVNRLLKEPQVPHRTVTHATPEVRPFTRMQARVLDHRRFLEALHVPGNVRGKIGVAVAETEGEISRFEIAMEGGRCAVKTIAGGSGGLFECRDKDWAAIATGDLLASTAVKIGAARFSGSGAELGVLDALGVGPTPFSHEYF